MFLYRRKSVLWTDVKTPARLHHWLISMAITTGCAQASSSWWRRGSPEVPPSRKLPRPSKCNFRLTKGRGRGRRTKGKSAGSDEIERKGYNNRLSTLLLISQIRTIPHLLGSHCVVRTRKTPHSFLFYAFLFETIGKLPLPPYATPWSTVPTGRQVPLLMPGKLHPSRKLPKPRTPRSNHASTLYPPYRQVPSLI